MALLVADCPHCRSARSSMVIFGVKAFPIETGEKVGRSPSHQDLFGWNHSIAAACQICSKPICAVVSTPHENIREQYAAIAQSVSKALLGEGSILTLGYRVVSSWPQPEAPATPEHLPPTVAKAFRSAEMNYRIPDGEDAAAMLYRRAIDVAIREKHPEVKGLLAPRIATLVEKGLLPPPMKQWADQIRLIGNDGAHEPEGVTMDDLTPMRGFTEAFLRYFITIPFEVALRRGEIDEQGNPIPLAEPPVAAV